jgi:hypothetical protein
MNRQIILALLALLNIQSAAGNPVEASTESRSFLGATVYNNNYAVISDRREISLPKGEIELEFIDVAMSILPATVSIQSDKKNGLTVDRSNYRYDLLNRLSLLERFVGRKLKYSRSLLEGDNYEMVLREGILLSINPEVVQFGDVIEVEPEGTISLPYLPIGLKTTPTLLFKGENRRSGKQEITARYHATGVGWEGDYILNLGKKSELSGWVTIRNESGSDFDIDQLSLVAGEVFHETAMGRPEMARMNLAMEADAVAPRAVGDFHRYDVPGQVSLLKHDTAQIRLFSAPEVATEKFYRLVSPVARYGNQGEQKASPVVVVVFDNERRNDLGIPLPAGTVRVYEDDGTFLGESRINHIAAGERVELETGRAFDLTAQRKQTTYRRLGERAVEVGYQIVVRNAGKQVAEIHVDEKLDGQWQIVEESQSGERVDARTYRYLLDVPPEGTSEIAYRVRINW